MSQKVVSKDDGLDRKTLFVRSVPFDATDDEFTDFFSQFAPVKHAVIVKDSEGQNRGFGFVSFSVEDDTMEALSQARKSKFKERLLRVDLAKRRERSKKNGEEDVKAVEAQPIEEEKENEDDLMKGKPKLIVRNMPWSCRDPGQLKKIFGRFGTVVEATIPRKRDGKLCGFAFVTMNKISNCKSAIEQCKDLKINGRKVAVDFAIQKSRWEEYKKDHTELESDDEVDDDGEGPESKQRSVDEDAEEEVSGDDDVELDSDEVVSDEEDENKKEEEEAEAAPKEKKNRREQFSVFVRNLPYDATQEAMEVHFSKFGPVKYALPVLDRETGLAKGTAFVAFQNEDAYNMCLKGAPIAGSTSLLINDDVQPEYVYEGRVLAISPTLDRESANRMAEKNAAQRKETLGMAPGEKDRRNLYLLNEGRIAEGSKLSQLLTPADMDVREKSYKLRVEQLKKNPGLHLSMTRLAIRNIPRAMTEKSLKALARKAVVEFAKEVKEEKRHPLTKEEISRSTKEKYKFMTEEEVEAQKKRDKKNGLVKQSKIIMEVKGSTVGRSRGYGFIEYRDHKSALMGLRWLNAHEVSGAEILEGMTEEEQKHLEQDALKKRRLVVEFAIENANVVKRRREKDTQARLSFKRRREEDLAETTVKSNKPSTSSNDVTSSNSGLSKDVKSLIGFKRRRKNKNRS